MKKKCSLLLTVILILLIVLSGCGSSNSSARTESYDAPKASASVDYSYDGITEADSSEVSSDIYTSENNKVIRTANMTIQTTEFDMAVEALNRLTTEQGGYFEIAQVESGSVYNKYASRSAYYVVRIPRENFIAFRDGTGGIGHIYSFTEETQDVGETYYDTEARLETLTTKRDRLLALLEQAEVMEDIISLENALADVQYQIDLHTATLRKYDSLIGYSTFYIHLNEVAVITEEPAVTETFGSRLAANLKAGFRNFGETMQDFAIWLARNLIGVVIFAAVVVAAVILIRRFVRRRRDRSQTKE